MKFTLNRKLWAGLLAAGCVLTACAVLTGSGRDAVCRAGELTAFPAPLPGEAALTGAGQSQQKQVCLTFDDGPSALTETVLDILKEEQVPATFFVVAAPNNEKYLPLIRREEQEGHQVALHSCTHEYRQIYQSPAAFWADIRQLREKISPYTDVDAIHTLRFPGGSTNTVSRKYGGSGIMTRLKRQAEEKGYTWVDWNVCAGDAAGGHPDADTLLENVKRETGDKSRCIVLMHDTKATRTTALALPRIIAWYRQQGYSFCRIQDLAL